MINKIMLMVVLLGGTSSGCVSTGWKKAARKCGSVMEETLPVLESCASHIREFHHGAKLNPDGSLKP